ncbi:hypothetical protein DQ04_02451110 [Trypanosoma grayi]|uniref:hypothetical protein n=1 Tax=Trypanosoma grayi TaxID=71804 RepID=UPI0004F46090|nr:hypothetical protein DQ04_02451110 [Trypanosoma grayi]KEG11609.1 hypothetical protein DQ04_02451110 [Trypanosoma grayi]
MAGLPLPTTEGGTESASPSLLSAVGNEWVRIRAYFMEVQMLEGEPDFDEICDRLAQVEHSLQVILDALLQEHTQMMPPRAVSRFRFGDRGSVSSISSKSSFFVSSQGHTPHVYYGNGGTAEGAARLPPCYTFLFSDMTPPTPVDANTETEEGLSAIGQAFLLSLCQFAKHNEPPGTRCIILRFLTRLLSEVDLPRSPVMGDPPRSLLQLFPSNTVVPLMDMIRQVGVALRSKTGRRNSLSAMSASSPSDVGKDAIDDEREAYLSLLCAIAERIEQVPALAAFFLPAMTTDSENETGQDAASASEAPSVLLHAFLEYITLRHGSLESKKRNDICRLALRGLLTLAKCPDPVIQDYVKKHTSAVSITLIEARTALLTLCKVPDNDDAAAQLCCICEVLRFWSQLLLLAPAVAEEWKVEQIIECNFVREALLPLFRSTDDTVYAAAAIVTARTVHAVGPMSPLYVSTVTRALLGTRVDPLTGKLARAHTAGAHTSSSNTVSLIDYALLPRLSVESDSDWRIVNVTLHLFNTLAQYEPALFMELALSLSMSTLAEVYMSGLRPSVQRRAKPSNGATEGKVKEGNAPVVAKARHVDCFLQPGLEVDLSAASTAPPLDIAECFPARLRAPKGVLLWTTAECIAEDILTHLLLVESHVPIWLLEERQRVMNRSCRNVSGNLMGLSPEGESCTVSQATSPDPQAVDGAQNTRKNIWFHEGVHQSPLVVRLCELTSSMLSIPSDVCTLLTNLWSTLCVLPDFRVLYTLLDPDHGRLRHALLKLRDAVDEGLQHDENVAFAVASAAAALAAGNTVKAPAVGNAAPHEIITVAENKSSTGLAHNAAPHLYTRTYLYSQFIQLGPSLRWVRDVVEREFPNHELFMALKKHRVFLEACACVEAFRMELDAVVGHVALSHNLMCLQTGKGQQVKKAAHA